jgi:membrane protein DedA with SNARE-associated domain
MDSASLQGTTQWIIANGYWILFLAILIEGPIMTAAGAFAAALGYMNAYFVFLLSVAGNLIPDIALYAIGYWGRKSLAEKYGHRVGLNERRIKYLENLLERHAGKALTIIKLLPILPTPGLILAGATRMPIKKYTFWSIVIIFPSSLFFLIIGYYFGAAYATVERYLHYGGYAIIGLIILFGMIYFFYKRISKKIAENIEKE